MKSINKAEIEKIDIEGWKLLRDTPTEKVYLKDNIEKRLQYFDRYSIEEHFRNDKLHGITIGRMNQAFLHYPNEKSTIYLVEYYENGKRTGHQFNFYDDGSREESNWQENKLHGILVSWYGNGQKEKEQNYIKGKLDGKQMKWYENGQLKVLENFAKGIPTGESLKYLENGMLKRKQLYKSGRIEGLVYELWDYKGRVIDGGMYSETEYEKNIPHGKETVYYPNKVKMREGINQHGKEQGERIWWTQNGIISIKEYFNNGGLDGERYLYDEQGELESIQKYSNGERIS
ncbi:toxin-antitoxin system YwqK family antitoxin [Chondrinema litorale]|uniref:toxin-antitoxin system YwqK family antitoxin n=1 Tax=Chondrinema litorale TaxID=2994555 RepID=UPI0025432245|nr:hypothetical protein [Chondrinema litorale]UZR96347.1 hypothetical protein OQ292_22065 [Chondrinema litorale]